MLELTNQYPFQVIEQGAVEIHPESAIKYESDKCLILYLDLKTKYCEVPFTSPNEETGLEDIIISCSEQTVSWKKGKDKEDLTYINCPNLKGWDIEFVNLNRYTLKVCYLKKRVQ